VSATVARAIPADAPECARILADAARDRPQQAALLF